MALALTIARVLVFALAPMLELEHALGPVNVLASASGEHTEHGLPTHDSATCPACLVLHTHASDPDPGVMPSWTEETRPQIITRVDMATPSAPRHGFLSRAPPRTFE